MKPLFIHQNFPAQFAHVARALYETQRIEVRALTDAATLDPRRLGEAALRTSFAAPEGDLAFDAENRHLWLTPGIGVARPDGQFEVVWRAEGPVRPDPWLAVARFEAGWAREVGGARVAP